MHLQLRPDTRFSNGGIGVIFAVTRSQHFWPESESDSESIKCSRRGGENTGRDEGVEDIME